MVNSMCVNFTLIKRKKRKKGMFPRPNQIDMLMVNKSQDKSVHIQRMGKNNSRNEMIMWNLALLNTLDKKIILEGRDFSMVAMCHHIAHSSFY